MAKYTKQLTKIKNKVLKKKLTNQDLDYIATLLKSKLTSDGATSTNLRLSSSREISISRVNPILKLLTNTGDVFNKSISDRGTLLIPAYSPVRLERAISKETLLKRKQPMPLSIHLFLNHWDRYAGLWQRFYLSERFLKMIMVFTIFFIPSSG